MNSFYNPALEHDACGVGFVARLDGVPHQHVVSDAITSMRRMAHRGGHVHDGLGGDGAGILTPIPHDFFMAQWPELGRCEKPWAVAQLFMPHDPVLQQAVSTCAADELASMGLHIEAERTVPVETHILTEDAARTIPAMRQWLICAADTTCRGERLERTLYLARRCMERSVGDMLRGCGADASTFYVASLSSRTIIYKGMLAGANLADLYTDLNHPQFIAPFAIFHERFSTNTLPAWHLAQPFRLVAHNGEINTLNGNKARMRIRESALKSAVLGDDLMRALPVIVPGGSDSASFDNALELLVRAGWDVPHALMGMVPEPFGKAFVMGDNKRAFYEYHAALMEPWDGPTCMVFTDGEKRVGALLDRNGLRPCRYSLSKDGVVLLASESGVVDLPPTARRGILRPRRMLMADMTQHRLMTDAEIKGRVIREHPYRRWLTGHSVRLEDLPPALSGGMSEHTIGPEKELQQKIFGMDDALIRRILLPMCRDAQEPVGAMGLDSPLAVLDARPQPLFAYFKQHFAQVTNPPIDPLREALSLSLMQFLGCERNLLEPTPEHCGMLRLPHPILNAQDMARLRHCTHSTVRLASLDATFPPQQQNRMADVLERLCADADTALAQGATLLAISDVATGRERVPVPALLAIAAVHQHLIRQGTRHSCALIAESGQTFEVMHSTLLLALGANAIHPYAVLRTVSAWAEAGRVPGKSAHEACAAYITALKKGLLKAMARLGISTVRSFWGSQCFEAVGLSSAVVQQFFPGVVSRLGGLQLADIAREAAMRHAQALEQVEIPRQVHAWTAQSVRLLHTAVRTGNTQAYADFVTLADEPAQPITLRHTWQFQNTAPVLLDTVEPTTSIIKRFSGAAMSLGSISTQAHETIAMGCNCVGARSNGGEGGEDPTRNTPDSLGRDRRSHVRQLASGRFGVTAEYLAFADEVQIKMAQGAKPGEGGQLPAYKVTAEIAALRGSMPGVSLISPPPHHDIYSIEDLAQCIFDIKTLRPDLRISVKLVAQHGVGTVAVGVVKAGAHIVCISGHDGGTGAAPLSSINHVGLPWEMGLAEAHQALIANGLRQEVRLQADGLMRTGRDVVTAFLLGADEVAFGTSLLVALGCVLCRQCHKGRCQAGIATQDTALRAAFSGTPEHVARYLNFVAEDTRRHMAQLGIQKVDAMVGLASLLKPGAIPPKSARLHMEDMLHALPCAGAPLHQESLHIRPATTLETALDHCADSLLRGEKPQVTYNGCIQNTDRAVGTRLSGRFAREGLTFPDHALTLQLRGSAGQSVGAFLSRGITLKISGDANDYAGKGLSGGILIVKPDAQYNAPEQAVTGNVALYGATAGEAWFGGTAGERFAVRNSGATAVVEGVGDHACEYMTGGIVLVLGECGYNFAAGMSGGIAFVYDPDERFQNRCNTDSVDLESLCAQEDMELVRRLLALHIKYTGSTRAQALLDDWDAARSLFVKIMPLEYKDALVRQSREHPHSTDTVAATEEVFHRGEDKR